MRITFVVGRANLSGGARVCAIYAQLLQQRGHEVTVVVRPSRKPTLRERCRQIIRGAKLPSETVDGPSHFDHGSFDLRFLDRYRAATAADVPDADVVIATWWETAEWVAEFPESKGAKAYFLQHYEAHGGLPVERVDATWRLPLFKIVIARWLERMAHERFRDLNTALVPNSVDLKQFNAPPRLRQATPTVGVMYSMVHFKGCDIALEAFGLAAQRLPRLRLVAFGDRAPTPQLPLPPDTRFVLLPPQDRIAELYAACDMWLVASRSEGFGLPILEAMACRTPVIATPTGAAPELLADGGGILVDSADPSAMADAIVHTATMASAQWRAMSDNAYATACRYTWDDATARFEMALHRAIAQSGHRSAAAAPSKGSVSPAA